MTFISQNSREIGLGSLLLDKILKVAKGNGVERSLIYWSTKDADSIVRFYKRHGVQTHFLEKLKIRWDWEKMKGAWQ